MNGRGYKIINQRLVFICQILKQGKQEAIISIKEVKKQHSVIDRSYHRGDYVAM